MAEFPHHARAAQWSWGLLLALLLITAAARLLPHPPNVTPVIALALFCGSAFPKRPWAVAALLGLMLSTDLILGVHSGMLAVYLALALVCVLGGALSVHSPATSIAGRGLLGAALFFVISNLSVWAFSGMYTLDAAGLVQCFTLAIPFFGNTLLGTALYGTLLFGIARRLPLPAARVAAPATA